MADSEEILPKQKNKNGFQYFYYLEYYPKRYQVSDTHIAYRQIIWNFKDGLFHDDFFKSLAEDFHLLNLNLPKSDWWICAIPASTKNKTENRFKRFCELYSSEASINNGYSLIFNKEDREAVHLQQDRNCVNLMDTIDFNSVIGKRLLLFDDIYTTGKSFLSVARKLKLLGATEVVGLFLGKTHWLESESNQDSDGVQFIL